MPAMISSSSNNSAAFSRRCSYTGKNPQQRHQHHQAVLHAAAATANSEIDEPLVDAPERTSAPLQSMALKLPEFPKLPFAALGGGGGGSVSPAKRSQQQTRRQSPVKTKSVALPRRAYCWYDRDGGQQVAPERGTGTVTGTGRASAVVDDEDEESREDRLRRLHARGTRSEGNSPTRGLTGGGAGSASATAPRRASTAAAAIPLPSTHVRRTASELQLRDDLAEAERRDWAMYARCVVRGGVNGTPNPPAPEQQQQQVVRQPQPQPQQPHNYPVRARYVEPEPQFGLPLDDDHEEEGGCWAVPAPQQHRHPHQPYHLQYNHNVIKPMPVKADAAAFLTGALEPQDYAHATTGHHVRHPSYHHAYNQHQQDYATSSNQEEEESSSCLFDMEL